MTTDKVYLEKHELEHDPIISSMSSQFMSPYSVGANVYSTVLAYRTDAFKASHAPQSWQDFWDINRFPGRRALRKHPFDTIEIALMADGVPPSEIYPCDLDRAFRSLDKIKPHISAWWTSDSQNTQWLRSNEIDLLQMSSNPAQEAIDAKLPVAICEEGQIVGSLDWAILKGTPKADLCRQFIKFASDPKRQVLLSAHSGFVGLTHPDAFKHIDPERVKLIPTYLDNLKKVCTTDVAYWFKNQNAVIERFNNWVIS